MSEMEDYLEWFRERLKKKSKLWDWDAMETVFNEMVPPVHSLPTRRGSSVTNAKVTVPHIDGTETCLRIRHYVCEAGHFHMACGIWAGNYQPSANLWLIQVELS